MRASRLVHILRVVTHAPSLALRPLHLPIARMSASAIGGSGATHEAVAAAPPAAAQATGAPAVPAVGTGSAAITVEEARARIKVLEAKVEALKAEMAPLRAIVKAEEDAAAFKQWLPEVVQDLTHTWGAPKTELAKAAHSKFEKALRAGLDAVPQLECYEETWKYYDPAWNVYALTYTWKDGERELRVKYRLCTNLNHRDVRTLEVNGESAGTNIDWANSWEDLAAEEVAEWEYPLLVFEKLKLWYS